MGTTTFTNHVPIFAITALYTVFLQYTLQDFNLYLSKFIKTCRFHELINDRQNALFNDIILSCFYPDS